VVTRPAVSLAQDRESSPAKTSGLTTMLRHQLTNKGKLEEERRSVGWRGMEEREGILRPPPFPGSFYLCEVVPGGVGWGDLYVRACVCV